jgi:asparagine synthase (glutamine-hydrolysing)
LEKHDILKYVGKKKLGFGMDLITLWDRYGAKLSTEYLEDAMICEEQLIDRDWLRSSLHGLKKNKDLRYVNKILHLLSLEIWYRVFVSKTLSPSKKLE